MTEMNLTELSKNEMIEIRGGGFKEAAFKVAWTVYKYSSLTGAIVTGIVEGYYEEKQQ